MTENECEKIIDQVTDPRNLDDQCRQHLKVCSKCAAVIACLTWVKAKGSPTADLKPSEAFINRIDQSLTPPSGSGSALTPNTMNNLTIWVIGIAVSLAIGAGILNSFVHTGNHSAQQTSIESSSGRITITESESEILNTQPDTPVLKFQSPADEID